jgi:feruloyl esterase
VRDYVLDEACRLLRGAVRNDERSDKNPAHRASARETKAMTEHASEAKHWLQAVVMAVILCAAMIPATARADTACDDLKNTGLPGLTVTSAAEHAAGTLHLPDGHDAQDLPAFCRVSGRLAPSADSDIGFEMWMPPAPAWNGKTMVVGNGGYVGEIRYDELAPAIRRGYAVISSDSGHANKVGYRNETLEWGVGHPDKIQDWAYRSIHAASVAARALVKVYEQRDASHAYYFGCSTGGGQGVAAAQRYPDDFDGIIAGAPGNNRSALNEGFLWSGAQNLKTKAGYIPPSKLPAINRAAIAACDAQDGLKDGLIADPGSCRFNPKRMQCKAGQDDDSCLSAAQVDTLKRLYAGARDPQTGKQIYPGWPVGSEFGYLGGWGYAIKGPQAFRTEFFRDWVFDDPNWDWRNFDWHRDPAIVKAKVGPLVDSIDPDLSAFQRHGGKLLLYHGLADPIGNVFDTVDYYHAVGRAVPHTPEFARLFLAPGMGHCRGGIGLNTFDAIGALEAWVEQGKAPDRIIAAARGVDSKTGGLATSADVDTQGVRTRPLCAYPQQAKYMGSGSIDDARNFVCASKAR